MAVLATATIVGLIFLNLIGLALATTRITGHYAMARIASPAAVALALFFVEHFVGLGSLRWCWPLTSAAAAWMVWTERARLVDHWRTEASFAVAFGWAFAWRYSYPGIVTGSEKIGDLAMIVSYMSGTRLPPVDAWFPPYPFDVYYSFQHYAAALLGRVFGLVPGLSYNLAFCVLIALTIAAVASGAQAICRSTWRAVLVTVAFAVGGTGAAIPVHFITPGPQLYANMRFIGDIATFPEVKTDFGRRLLTASGVTAEPQVKIPTETFAYLAYLGDYHPPLSGFYLLAIALMCIAMIEAGQAPKAAQALLAASIPPCAIANGWTLPFQALLVVTWVCYRVWDRRAVDWRALGLGLSVAGVACYPFLSTFGYRAADYNVSLKWVPADEHTPIVLGLMVLGPLLAMIAIPLLFRDRRGWVIWSAGLWLGLLLISEFFYVDDVYSGIYNRFNTTLKWWPWVQAGAMAVLGAHGLRSTSRNARVATIAVLSLTSVYGIDLTRHLVFGFKGDFGKIEGAAAITDDPIEKVIFEYLRAQPPVIVLQRPETGAFTPSPALTLLAGQHAFMGWPEHEKLWRGQRADVQRRADEVQQFYNGNMPDSIGWLIQNNIDHVLWLKTDYKLPKDSWGKLNARLESAYFWREYYKADDFRVGLWSRRPVPLVKDAPPAAATP
jgi:hypothetical protein